MGIKEQNRRATEGNGICRRVLQSSFTEHRRIEDNLYKLKYCVEESYLLKKTNSDIYRFQENI